VIDAIHPGNDRASKRADSDNACGLEAQLGLCVGAKVMLTENLWVEQGLVNGSIGYVRAIIFKDGERPPSMPKVVLVDFPDYKGRRMPGNVFPITSRTFHWDHKGKNCTRIQIPLTVAGAITVHRSQSLTVDCVVVDVGPKEICGGLTYVALSRVKNLKDLCIYPINKFRLLQIIARGRHSER
jgi:ATP-dependent exoDNAse (exonuclease V) alpha subunit